MSSYSIASGDDTSAKFQVDGSSTTVPAIITTATPLDYETKQIYTLLIHIVDNGSPVLTSTGTVFITVST